MARVSITKCGDYSQERVDAAVREAVELIGGVKNFVKKGDKVLLKPNLLLGAGPERSVTTHPAVLRSVIALVRSAGATPYVGDSPAFGSFLSVMKKTGLHTVCAETGVEMVEFSGKKFENPKGKVAKSFFLDKDALEYDAIIDLPKLKTHSFTDYSGAVKNLFGLVVGLEKGKYHMRFQDKALFYGMLLDLYLMVKPKLTIMDAVVGMEGDGPNAGTPRDVGLILASSDALALDYAAMRIIDMEGTALHHAAEGRDLVPKVDIVGERIDELIIRDFKKPSSFINPKKRRLPKWAGKMIEKTLKKAFVLDPVVNKKDCTGCKTCFIVCPSEPKTISMRKGNQESERKNPNDIYPEFDYTHCIHCYCCHESCPEEAIVLKRRLFQKRLDCKFHFSTSGTYYG